MGRTTLTVRDETHKQLVEIKHATRSRSFDEAIQKLIEDGDLEI